MEIRGDEVRLSRPVPCLVAQIPLSIAGPNQRRSRAGAPGRLQVAFGCRRPSRIAQGRSRAPSRHGAASPASASGTRIPRRAGEGSSRFRRGRFRPLARSRSKIPVDLPQHLFREIAPTDTGLVRDHDREEPFVPDGADRFDRPGKETEPARMAHVADGLVEGAVAVEKYRGLSGHEIARSSPARSPQCRCGPHPGSASRSGTRCARPALGL